MFSNPRAFLINLVQSMKASFWLIPLCMLVASLIFALIVVEYDLYLAAEGERFILPKLRLSTEGARMILSAIAGSMITVASLVFSMTLVALSLVASQLGPRILQIFMEDRPTQVVLGLFIATFLFAMIVLGSVGFGRGDEFIPTLGVIVSGGLAVIAFVGVILFVHHIARQIQADVVIHQTSDKLLAAAKNWSKDTENGAVEWVDREKYEELRDAFADETCQVSIGPSSGYVEYIDTRQAVHLAKEHNLKITLLHLPGEFMIAGRPVMKVSPARRVTDKISKKLKAIVQLGDQRTREQRVDFEMLALVEIALRALSKGINDPFTAISCINWLSAGLAKLMDRYPDYRVHCDADERIRVLEAPQTFAHYLEKTFSPIRVAATDLPMVLDRLRDAVADLQAIAIHQPHQHALDEQMRLLKATVAKLPQQRIRNENGT
jgi:uncharacterized membrane protein